MSRCSANFAIPIAVVLLFAKKISRTNTDSWITPITIGILNNSAGEFEDTEEVYEAVGEVLLGISEKSEDDIRFDITFIIQVIGK